MSIPELALNVFVGYPRKRTERTAMAEGARMQDDWWKRVSGIRTRHRATAIRPLRQNGKQYGWSVTLERVR